MSGYYPAGTDLGYFDDESVEEIDPNGDEEVECLSCGKEFDVAPSWAQMVGGDDGEYQWWVSKVECPHCGDVSDYGNCD